MVEYLAQNSIAGWILDGLVLPDAKLCQGDLIKFENETNPIKRTGVVVTADCDLAQNKHARSLTLVPVVSAKIIVEHYLIPEDCERKRQLIEEYVFKHYSINKNQDIDTKIAMLRESTFAKKEDTDNIARIASEFLLGNSDFMLAGSYKELMIAIKSGPKKLESLKSQIRSRGDLLILPDAPSLGIQGSIAWVRHIWQVPVSEIAIRTSEIRNRSGERIARLDSPYRYRLTQLMAQVFSDIGLPNTPDMIDKIVEDTYNDA